MPYDALPLPVFQIAGNTSVTLLDLLTRVYGDQVGLIASVNIEFRDWTYLQNAPASWGGQPFSYWDTGQPDHHARGRSSQR